MGGVLQNNIRLGSLCCGLEWVCFFGANWWILSTFFYFIKTSICKLGLCKKKIWLSGQLRVVSIHKEKFARLWDLCPPSAWRQGCRLGTWLNPRWNRGTAPWNRAGLEPRWNRGSAGPFRGFMWNERELCNLESWLELPNRETHPHITWII